MACCNMICSDCGCGCYILPPNCLRDANFRVKKFHADEKPEILNAVNTFIIIGTKNDGLLGQSCFDALCNAIKTAQADANEYISSNPNFSTDDELADFWYYLPEIWYDLLKNYHFVNMYAAYVVYYYYKLGYADAETTLDGDVNHNRGANINQNDGTKNITSSEGQSKSAIQLGIAKGHYDAFINNYWSLNKGRYNCERPKECLTQCSCNTGNCSIHTHTKKINSRPRPTAL